MLAEMLVFVKSQRWLIFTKSCYIDSIQRLKFGSVVELVVTEVCGILEEWVSNIKEIRILLANYAVRKYTEGRLK